MAAVPPSRRKDPGSISLSLWSSKETQNKRGHTLQAPARSTHPLATVSPKLESRILNSNLRSPTKSTQREFTIDHTQTISTLKILASPQPTDSAWTPRRYEPLLTDSRTLSHYCCSWSIHRLHPFTRPQTVRPLTLSTSKPISRHRPATTISAIAFTVSPFTANPYYHTHPRRLSNLRVSLCPPGRKARERRVNTVHIITLME